MYNANEKCPYCGSFRNVIGFQDGYGSVQADKALTLKSQRLYHVFCLDCGTLIRSFVRNPERLVLNK
ncbi:MAG: hypothetical protein E7515_00500 [Ruminococcaceae bacterium]|jgi:ribosomal protein L32|nr:hypothetical protein [Oscillospiraceae bacterium]